MSEAIDNWAIWQTRFASFAEQQTESDAAHDLSHVRRVVTTAGCLALEEGAELAVVIPAAWLHDCVTVPKNSPMRPQASRLAADRAARFLRQHGYPLDYIPAIQHAIAAHSFSANITPETVEARVVQDADRLDAIGAVGIARCFMLGGALGTPFYNLEEPLPESRQANNSISIIDHFYTKLLKLADSMQTGSGRREAAIRTDFMRQFLREMAREIGVQP